MSKEPWPTILVDYIKALHGVDVIWKPAFDGEEPPF